jgi:hypothetical protein
VARASGVGGRVSSDGSYVVIDPDAVKRFVRDGGGPVMADLTRRATNVQAGARRQVGKRTWRLHDSIVKRPGIDAKGPYVDVVTEGVKYAIYHHNGNSRGWHGNPFLADNLHLANR